MKYLKLKIHKNKFEFVKELLSHFDFVEMEQTDTFEEPRVYPNANFELRSSKSSEEKSRAKSTGPSPEDVEKLRLVINRIDAIRDQSRR